MEKEKHTEAFGCPCHILLDDNTRGEDTHYKLNGLILNCAVDCPDNLIRKKY